MRAHTTTTKFRPRRTARYCFLALALGISALAFPASAGAQTDSAYSSVNAITGGSDDPSQSSGGAASGNAHRTVTELGQSTASEPSSPSGSGGSQSDSGYSSLNAITGPPASEPTLVSSSPTVTSDGFDWASAAVGAGAAMALVALGGAAVLTVRRRTGTSHAPAAG